MKTYKNIYERIISLDNLFSAWDAFKSGKQNRIDVREFEWRLEENIFALHRDLRTKQYKHGAYRGFWIKDPKPRRIHKATVRDRVLHHAIFIVLNPIFEPTFIAHSFSCRIGKGTHKGINTLANIIQKVSGNGHKKSFILKCDVRKFFDTIDHSALLHILGKKIRDADAMWLLSGIIESFTSNYSNLFERRGVPIGNLTSQLFANVYMNEFDQFVKHELKAKHYIRYTDDFIIVDKNRQYLECLLAPISSFLKEKLFLELHPKKISIRKSHQGIDFLGYVLLPHHRMLRTKTKHRIFRRLKQRVNEYKRGIVGQQTLEQSLQSYLGVLSHANSYKLNEGLKNDFGFWLSE